MGVVVTVWQWLAAPYGGGKSNGTVLAGILMAFLIGVLMTSAIASL